MERHLRVDQYYSLPTSAKGQKGFSAAHYTENYYHPESGDKITVHLYFAGVSQTVQIKKIKADRSIEMIDEKPIIMAIQFNGFEALCFYQKIEKEKNKRYFDALTLADQTERKMRRLHCSFSTSAQILEYVKIADEFCVLVDRVNYYNELMIDCRGEFIQKTKTTLLQKLENLTATKAPEVEPLPLQLPEDKMVVIDETPPEVIALQYPPKQAVSVHQPDVLQTIERLAAKIKRCVREINPGTIVSAYAIADKLREALLLYSIPKKLSSKAKQAIKYKISTIEEQIQSLPDVGKYAKEAALKGNLDAIVIVFKLLSFEQQIAILTALYTALLDDMDDNCKLAEQMRSICEYFNQNSKYYAAFVTKQSMTLFFHAKAKHGFSFLLKAAFKNKKATFAMFLQHGMDPNGIGYFVEHLPYANLKIFAHIIPDPYYSSCLIEYGATLNAPSKYLSYDESAENYRIISNEQAPYRVQNGVLEERDIMAEVAEISDLSTACAGLNFSAIPAFLDHSDIIVKAHAFARAMNIIGFMRRVLPYSTEPGIFLCDSLKEADSVRDKFFF